MSHLNDIQAALQSEFGAPSVRTASIGGSGTWALDRAATYRGFPETLPEAGPQSVWARFADVDTPFGPIPQVKLIVVEGQPVIRIPAHGWRFPLPGLDDTLAVFWLLSRLAVEQALVDASVGGIRAKPWDVVVPDDVLVNDHAKLAVTRLGQALGRTPWVRMADPFCPRLRRVLISALKRYQTAQTPHHPLGELMDGGLYVCTPLSVFETAAEIRLLHAAGATVVGQSMGQEAAAARVCGICLAVVNPVANYAEGLGGGVWIEGGMDRFYEECALPMGLVVYWALQEAVAQPRDCRCTSVTTKADVSRFTTEADRAGEGH
jgi:5'-methylthioadenosine phosphorylase